MFRDFHFKPVSLKTPRSTAPCIEEDCCHFHRSDRAPEQSLSRDKTTKKESRRSRSQERSMETATFSPPEQWSGRLDIFIITHNSRISAILLQHSLARMKISP